MRAALGAAMLAGIWASGSTSTPAFAAEASKLIAGLEPGPHPVGVTVWYRADPDRLFENAGGTPGPRPLQIALWYPAARDGQISRDSRDSRDSQGSPGSTMTLREYLLLVDRELGSEPAGQEPGRHLEYVRGLALAQGADPEALDRVLARVTLAVRDAEPAAGAYPTVLLAPGHGAHAFQNPVLAEYLASHGFVVAAIPSLGARSREPADSTDDLEAYGRDLDFVLGALGELPAADLTRVGAVGYSFGGMAVTLLAMTNPRVDAIVTHDPGYLVARNQPILQSASGYAPERLSQPLLVLRSGAVKAQPDLKLVATLGSPGVQRLGTRPDIRVFSLDHLRHGDFASLLVELFVHSVPAGKGRDREKIDAGYACATRSTLAFLTAALQESHRLPEAQVCSPGVIREIPRNQWTSQEPAERHWWWIAGLSAFGAVVLVWFWLRLGRRFG